MDIDIYRVAPGSKFLRSAPGRRELSHRRSFRQIVRNRLRGKIFINEVISGQGRRRLMHAERLPDPPALAGVNIRGTWRRFLNSKMADKSFL